jgi:TatA/E family protein of Tat protein translocase
VFSIGGQELFIIAVLVLLLFGPDKIPQLARTVGRFMKEFNKYKDIMESTIRMEIARTDDPADSLTTEQRIAKAGAASQDLIEKKAAAEAAERARDVPVLVADESDEEEEE